MAADPASCADLPFEPASIIRLIRGFVAYGNQSNSDLPDPEAAGMLLWDLSVDTDSAPGLLQLQLLPALSAQLTAVLSNEALDQGAPAQPSPSTAFPAHRADTGPPWGDGSPPAAAAASPGHAASPAHAEYSLQDNSSRPSVAPARMAEICCGILANLYSAPAVIPQLVAQTDLTAAVAALFMSLTDPPALAELCRLLTAALSTPQGCSTWLPVLPESITWLLHIVSNTLHPLLLERAMQLIAALLAAGNAAAEEHAAAAAAAQAGSPTAPGTAAAATPRAAEATTAAGGRDAHPSAQESCLPEEPPAQAEQQEQQQQQQSEQDHHRDSAADAVVLLLQQGLPAALEAILSPAAAPGAQLQQQLLQQLTSSPVQANCEALLAEAPTAGGGGWSDEEDVAAPAAVGANATVDQRSRQVYSQPQVLIAALSCLEQCGQQRWVMEEMQQHLQELPQLLLQLLLRCHHQAQQDVLEVLLPVLVTFRAGVLPLMRPSGAEVREQTGAEQLNGSTEVQQLRERSVQCLELWVCVAAVLNDCGPDSLDAMDAAWYLLAAAMLSAGDVLEQVLLLQKTTVWAQERLQHLCRCVSESTVPETSQGYSMQCLSSLTAAIMSLQQTVGTVANAAALLGTLRACRSQLE